MKLAFDRTAMGRYDVLTEGKRIGRVRTTLRNEHWFWIVTEGSTPAINRRQTFGSREAAAAALTGYMIETAMAA